VKPFDRLEAPAPNPGQAIVEDHVIGTIWKLKPSTDVQAWDLGARLTGKNGELKRDALERADPRGWTDAPPLWSGGQGRDYSWEFALVDETAPDDYTRKVHGGYLEITRVWGDDRYEFTGYTLDLGHVSGIVTVPTPARFVQKDRFKGAFFLWPAGDADPHAG